MASVDWYFDFVSPYSYLQLERLANWPAEFPLAPKPVLFAGLLSHWEHKGPAEIVPKRKFIYRQVQWLAAHDGVTMRFPPRHPFNPLRGLRLAIALGGDMGTIRTIFRHIWRDGNDINDPASWRALTERLGAVDAERMIADPEVKAQLRANTEGAIAAGVFGVPTLLVEGEVFWGVDATAMALECARNPVTFLTEEMRRVDTLPIGATRGG